MSNGNKPAFPYSISADIESTEEQGLTKREYFAAMAMQGVLSAIYTNGDGYREQLEMWKKLYPGETSVKKAVALDAVAYADELLKQLEKE